MKARISHLHKTEAKWSKLKSWIPEAGEFIIYDPDENHSYARIKLGDGKNCLQDLPFFIEATIKAHSLTQQGLGTTVDGGRVTQYQ